MDDDEGLRGPREGDVELPQTGLAFGDDAGSTTTTWSNSRPLARRGESSGIPSSNAEGVLELGYERVREDHGE